MQDSQDIYNNLFNEPELQALKGCTQHPTHHPEGDVWEHTQLVFAHTEGCCDTVRLAAIFHDTGKPETKDGFHFYGHQYKNKAHILERYGIDYTDVKWLCDNHMIHDWSRRRKFKKEKLMSDPRFSMLIELHKADCMGRKMPSNVEEDYASFRHTNP